MKKLQLIPNGWPCLLSEVPPGFFTHGDELCFASEYGDRFCDSGEFLHIDNVKVQPVIAEWVEE